MLSFLVVQLVSNFSDFKKKTSEWNFNLKQEMGFIKTTRMTNVRVEKNKQSLGLVDMRRARKRIIMLILCYYAFKNNLTKKDKQKLTN